MQTAGSGPDSPSIAIFATLTVTASGHPGNSGLGEFEIPVANVASLTEKGLKLRDGTLLKRNLMSGKVVIKTQFGRFSLPAADIVSITAAGTENN